MLTRLRLTPVTFLGPVTRTKLLSMTSTMTHFLPVSRPAIFMHILPTSTAGTCLSSLLEWLLEKSPRIFKHAIRQSALGDFGNTETFRAEYHPPCSSDCSVLERLRSSVTVNYALTHFRAQVKRREAQFNNSDFWKFSCLNPWAISGLPPFRV
jgi:hypothetical protein